MKQESYEIVDLKKSGLLENRNIYNLRCSIVNDGDFLLSKQMKKDSVEKTIKSSFNFAYKANRRLRGHSTHPDLQYRTEEQTSSVIQEISQLF